MLRLHEASRQATCLAPVDCSAFWRRVNAPEPARETDINIKMTFLLQTNFRTIRAVGKLGTRTLYQLVNLIL